VRAGCKLCIIGVCVCVCTRMYVCMYVCMESVSMGVHVYISLVNDGSHV